MNELVETINVSIPQLPSATLFVLFFFGTFVSEDAACLAAGAAAANGRISVMAAIAACLLGIFVGDMLLFAAGRVMGTAIFENRMTKRLISADTRSRAGRWVETNGASAVFLSRFATGLRLPTYLAAGALKTDVRKFALYFFIAAAIWTPLLVGSAAFAQFSIFRENLILGIVLLFIAIRSAIKYSSWKNRQLLVGRIKRIVNWEFWPIQIFYTPVVAYVVWLMVRHRTLTAFTAVNPSIPAGGFKGESKNDIYGLLGGSSEYLLPHRLIPAGLSRSERIAIALEAVDEFSPHFPVVLKPDAGERGKGVRIIHSFNELNEALEDESENMILQQFADGEEVSIFYYRRPSEPRGRIFSLTEKQFPVVRGDGRSTIEELILKDRRAVALAAKYFEHNRARLQYIPDAGDGVKLIEIGTHSRGAIFLDGGRHLTRELEDRIDEICQKFNGFYFGRFDIRVPSFADLQRGRKLKIVELNGVTSESTNIYDPRYSLLDAYRILFRQWRIAFEIGSENIKLGVKQEGILSLAKMVFC